MSRDKWKFHRGEALAVAQFLDSIGEHKRANDVRRVCRSLAGTQATLKVAYRDNMKLRQELTNRAS